MIFLRGLCTQLAWPASGNSVRTERPPNHLSAFEREREREERADLRLLLWLLCSWVEGEFSFLPLRLPYRLVIVERKPSDRATSDKPSRCYYVLFFSLFWTNKVRISRYQYYLHARQYVPKTQRIKTVESIINTKLAFRFGLRRWKQIRYYRNFFRCFRFFFLRNLPYGV